MRESLSSGLRLAPLYATAIAGGGIWALCFGVSSRPLLSWFALVPLLFLLERAQSLRLAMLHGFSSWLLAISWISPTLTVYGELPAWLGWGGLLLLAAYLGSYHLLFAVLARPSLCSAWAALIVLPAVWVVLEVLRGWLLSGFPWNLAAYAWIDVPGALALAAWCGPYGISYLVVFTSTAAYLAWARRSPDLIAVCVLVPLLLLGLGARFATPRQATAADRRPAPLEVRIIQPNTPILTNADSEDVVREYRKLFRLSREACDRPGTLLVWPESAAWPYALERDAAFRREVEALTGSGCALLLNSPRWDEEAVFNSAFITAGKRTSHYDKRQLVPFGEYVPLARLLPFVASLARNAGNFSAGEEATLLEWNGHRIGVSICYEITFPSQVAELVVAGATLLGTLTNDAWYGNTSAPHQHLRAARFRAAENGRPLVRAALTGISAAIDRRGRVLEKLDVGEQGIIRVELQPSHSTTFYSRTPWLLPTGALAIVVSAIFWRLRERLQGSPQPPRERHKS